MNSASGSHEITKRNGEKNGKSKVKSKSKGKNKNRKSRPRLDDHSPSFVQPPDLNSTSGFSDLGQSSHSDTKGEPRVKQKNKNNFKKPKPLLLQDSVFSVDESGRKYAQRSTSAPEPSQLPDPIFEPLSPDRVHTGSSSHIELDKGLPKEDLEYHSRVLLSMIKQAPSNLSNATSRADHRNSQSDG